MPRTQSLTRLTFARTPSNHHSLQGGLFERHARNPTLMIRCRVGYTTWLNKRKGVCAGQWDELLRSELAVAVACSRGHTDNKGKNKCFEHDDAVLTLPGYSTVDFTMNMR